MGFPQYSAACNYAASPLTACLAYSRARIHLSRKMSLNRTNEVLSDPIAGPGAAADAEDGPVENEDMELGTMFLHASITKQPD